MVDFRCDDCTNLYETKATLDEHLKSEWHPTKKQIIALGREAEEIHMRNKGRGTFRLGFKKALGEFEKGRSFEIVRRDTIPYIRAFKESGPEWTDSERKDAEHIIEMAYEVYQLEERSKNFTKI